MVESDISSRNGQFALFTDTTSTSVNQNPYIEGRIDSNTAQIQVQAGEISSKVSTNGVISAINQTAESIKIMLTGLI